MGTAGEGLLYAEQCYQIMGACFAVYDEMGSAFLESVYQECVELELARRNIPFSRQHPMPLTYRGAALRQGYVADFLCFHQVILEIKAVETIADEHRAQVLNYLGAARVRLGLLVNFGHHPRLQWQRLVL